MALSANTFRVVERVASARFLVASAAVCYKGSLVGLNSSGLAGPLGASYPNFVGIADQKVTGDGSTEYVTCCQLPTILKGITVTGASAQADVGKPVNATDDGTFTLTLTSGYRVGRVLEWITSTTCDVVLVPPMGVDARLFGQRELLYLGHYDFASTADGNLRTAIPLPFRGKIVDVFAMVDVAMTGSGGTTAINLEIGGVNVTGGVVTVSTAAGGTKGTKLAGTAVTAANMFEAGDTLDVEAASSGGTRTTGTFDLYATVERQ